jgi:hypothetical protein
LVWPRTQPHPANDSAVAPAICAHSDDFSLASAAIVTALRQDREVTIALSVVETPGANGKLIGWRCVRGVQGIDLVPMDFGSEPFGLAVKPRDVLVACDPWGEAEGLFQMARTTALRGATTIAITGDRPNLLAAQATHVVRVPIELPSRPRAIITVLRHLVQAAGASLVATPPGTPAWRRVGLL